MSKLAFILLSGLCLSACATAGHAQCMLADTLIRRYGISFSGMEKDLPRTTAPVAMNRLPSMPLPNGNGQVRDGFEHRAFIDRERKLVWIKRTGGFAGVREWYGPVALDNADIADCPALTEAAVRFCPERGVTMLRGMQVQPGYRRHGTTGESSKTSVAQS